MAGMAVVKPGHVPQEVLLVLFGYAFQGRDLKPGCHEPVDDLGDSPFTLQVCLYLAQNPFLGLQIAAQGTGRLGQMAVRCARRSEAACEAVPAIASPSPPRPITTPLRRSGRRKAAFMGCWPARSRLGSSDGWPGCAPGPFEAEGLAHIAGEIGLHLAQGFLAADQLTGVELAAGIGLGLIQARTVAGNAIWHRYTLVRTAGPQ